MFEYLKFILSSTIECTALLTLICSVFCIPIKYAYKKIIVTAMAFAFISLLITINGLHTFNIFIQLPIIVLLFRYMFNENGRFSFWISIVGYAAMMAVQGVLSTICMLYDLIGKADMQPFSAKGQILQLASSSIVFLVSYYFIRFREGFIFNFNSRLNKNNTTINLYILCSTVVFISIGFLYPLFFYGSDLGFNFILSILSCIVGFFLLLLLSNKRNKAEFQPTLHERR